MENFNKELLRPMSYVAKRNLDFFAAEFPLRWLIISDGVKKVVTEVSYAYSVESLYFIYEVQCRHLIPALNAWATRA